MSRTRTKSRCWTRRRAKLLSRFPLAGCDGPTGIAYDPPAGEIVSACGNGVAVVSAPDGRQIGWLMIGKGADGAAYDAKRHLVLIPAGRDGNLSIIRLRPSPAVVAQIPTAVSARTIALDPATGRAYLPVGDACSGGRQRAAEGGARHLPGARRRAVN